MLETRLRRLRRGFTLIELLVVIAIIAILAAILFPVFAQARESARQATCVSNMKQIGMGITMYAQDNDETFPFAHNPQASPWTVWNDLVEPYIKVGVKQTAPNSFARNVTTFWSCPSFFNGTVPKVAGDPDPPLTTTNMNPSVSYMVNGNLMPSRTPGSNWFPATAPATLAAIGSSSQVVLCVHNSTSNSTKTMTGGDDVTTGCMGNEAGISVPWPSYNYCAGRFHHNGGAVYLLADGHAKWFRGPNSWRAASTSGVAWRKSLAPNATAWFRED